MITMQKTNDENEDSILLACLGRKLFDVQDAQDTEVNDEEINKRDVFQTDKTNNEIAEWLVESDEEILAADEEIISSLTMDQTSYKEEKGRSCSDYHRLQADRLRETFRIFDNLKMMAKTPPSSLFNATDFRMKDADSVYRTPSQVDFERHLDKMRFQFDRMWAKKPEPSGVLKNFEICHLLGSGAFGKVVLVKHIQNQTYHAMKVQQKGTLVKTKQVQHTLYEKRILQAISFPFVVNMEYCFKDNTYIYFVMPFVSGGDMFVHLRKMKRFQESLCKFYAAQVVLALEYIHYLHLVYRDLKPENILLDNDGYLKITDFGFCKYVRTRTWTLCGTPDYLAPEIILSKGYGQSVDWWSFGVLVYEMAAGYAPFYDHDQMVTYEKIVGLKYRYPADFGMEIKDLIRNLLQVDLSRRYGILKRGIYDIKNHPFFKDINWTNVYEKSMKPVFIPPCIDPADMQYFDPGGEINFQVELVDKYEKEFADF